MLGIADQVQFQLFLKAGRVLISRIVAGRLFQVRRSATSKARLPILVFVPGTKTSDAFKDIRIGKEVEIHTWKDIAAGRLFQVRGSATSKARLPILVFVPGTKTSDAFKDIRIGKEVEIHTWKDIAAGRLFQ